ncbi:MAG: GAF domain-containing protein [Alphaproteobacteria bacterium]|nr:GAF domain-containing protein [Alphaproteobacteria bacterium]MCW5739747.1 GAF domain-containing protein [Alphaproteobacteria bacterium]
MRRGLFTKYVVLFIGLVALVLTINAALDLYFTYEENRSAAITVQREKAEAAAQRIESFVREIERQIGWVAHPQWALLDEEQRRFDYVRLQRQVPAIAELSFIDRRGREQLKVSRLTMDVIGSGTDRSTEKAYVDARAHRLYFGPVYFHKDSEPHLTMAVSHGGRGGVTVAVINLKLIVDVVAQIRVGKDGYAYVVDSLGRLVAHPDMSLVLRGTDMTRVSQVAAALSREGGTAVDDARNLQGVSVLSSHAAIPALNWLVFVELPTSEAREPVIAAGYRALALLAGGILVAALAAALLARRMVIPIRALQAGAARIGGGELGYRLDIRTGDELEALARQFNHSAEALEESYATLEQRVTDRTRELSESLEQQTATTQVLQVINSSPSVLAPVFDAMLEKAMTLCQADFGFLMVYEGGAFSPAAMRGVPDGLARYFSAGMDQPRPGEAHARVLSGEDVIHNLDLKDDDVYRSGNPLRHAVVDLGGARSALVVALRRDGITRGALTVYRKEVRPFSEKQIALMQNFAAQAVIAIENARLITELRESLEQQTATAEILRVISESPTDVQPVLDVVVSAARRFCGASDAVIALHDGNEVVLQAHDGTLTASVGARRPLDASNGVVQSIIAGRTVHIPDVSQLDPAQFAPTIALAREHKWHSAIIAPMLREGDAIGSITLRRIERGPFTARQIELLETFASQAVIAIGNVRLFTEIQEKSRQLEIASQHKSQFLANMSHELRTPLNAILGYTEMMADGLYGDVGDKAQGVLERVQTNGRHLLGLINDVLDLSKIEAGQLTLSLEEYSVADAVGTVVSATESLARAKGLSLTTDVAEGLPTGTADARRLSQVLLNLVGNALKFTDQGGVEIRAVKVADRFELSVVDTGPGIAEADQAKIFDEFQQVDNTSTRRKGGTGLGLSISRKIVELHGGRITVQSEPGKGSTFTVSIPIHAASVREAAQ